MQNEDMEPDSKYVDVELEKTDADDDDEILEDPFDPKEIRIIHKQESLYNIIERMKHEEIEMNTEFQREVDLWNNVKMSRLVESILIRFPLPAFYFDATDDDKWLVVDGLQRLCSVKKFVVEKNLKLVGLEYLKDIEKKKYDDLPRVYKRRIDECAITLFLIQPGTPEKVKYSIFKRINTGGLVLNFQEIRNALSSKKLRNYLNKLSDNEYMKKIIGGRMKRMQGQELVLRFIAFYINDYNSSKKNITLFLDYTMNQLEKMDEYSLCHLEDIFIESVKRSWDIFEKSAFEKNRNSNEKRKRKNATLFEVWTVALANISNEEMNILLKNKEKIKSEHSNLIDNDSEYFNSVTFSTQKKESYRTRCDRVGKLIQEVLKND